MGVEDTPLQVPAELGDAGPFVRRTAGTLGGYLSGLQNQLAPLPETWKDTGNGASTQYQNYELEWRNAAADLFGDGQANPGILGDIAHRLDVAWYNYVTAQNTNTKMWLH
jgi:hypothetical protein